MALTQNCILNHQQINHKIKRIAYQIYESNVEQKEIILAGIYSNGYILAEKIKQLEKISEIKVKLCEVKINKKNPTEKITTSFMPRRLC